MLDKIRSLLFLIGFIPATVIHATLSLLVSPFLPLRKRFRFVTLLNRFVIWWFSLACGVRYRIEGLENIPHDRAGVLVANHQSEWETFYLQIVVSPLSTVLKKELLIVPFFGWALALIQPIAIDRKDKTNAFKQIINQGVEKIKSGIWVLIFPEGTRVAPGETRKFTKTGARLAANTGALLVPVAHNAGECWPPRGYLKRSGTIHIVFGEPLDPAEHSATELYEKSTLWIEAKRAEISAADYS